MKLNRSTTILLLQLREEIKSYGFENIENTVYACFVFLMRGFSPVVQTRITDKFFEMFRWGR